MDRVQRGVDDLIAQIERGSLRPCQRDGYLCAAKCCENSSLSHEQLQQCLQQCSARTAQAEQALNQELNAFQQRLQRCAMSCRDRVQDRMPVDGSPLPPQQMAALQSQVEQCANRCADDHLALLPKIAQRIEASIAKR